MAHDYYGSVSACVKDPRTGKNHYYRVGTAYQGDRGISIKLDTIPIPQANWDGWLNIFPPDKPEDDIPF